MCLCIGPIWKIGYGRISRNLVIEVFSRESNVLQIIPWYVLVSSITVFRRLWNSCEGRSEILSEGNSCSGLSGFVSVKDR